MFLLEKLPREETRIIIGKGITAVATHIQSLTVGSSTGSALKQGTLLYLYWRFHYWPLLTFLFLLAVNSSLTIFRRQKRLLFVCICYPG